MIDKESMPKIIVIHNHPSGDPTPSRADYNITEKLQKACNLMGVELLDHIVIGDGKYESIFYNKQKLNS